MKRKKVIKELKRLERYYADMSEWCRKLGYTERACVAEGKSIAYHHAALLLEKEKDNV